MPERATVDVSLDLVRCLRGRRLSGRRSYAAVGVGNVVPVPVGPAGRRLAAGPAGRRLSWPAAEDALGLGEHAVTGRFAEATDDVLGIAGRAGRPGAADEELLDGQREDREPPAESGGRA